MKGKTGEMCGFVYLIACFGSPVIHLSTFVKLNLILHILFMLAVFVEALNTKSHVQMVLFCFLFFGFFGLKK